MLDAVGMNEINHIFGVTDAMGIHREQLVIPLGTGKGRVRRLPNGKLVNQSLGIFSLGGATIDNEWNHMQQKLLRAYLQTLRQPRMHLAVARATEASGTDGAAVPFSRPACVPPDWLVPSQG